MLKLDKEDLGFGIPGCQRIFVSCRYNGIDDGFIALPWQSKADDSKLQRIIRPQ